jgi:hypothetical protein
MGDRRAAGRAGMRAFRTAVWCCILTAGLTAIAVVPAVAGSSDHDISEFGAKSRTRITIYPRTIYPGPNAKRHCQSWLAKEYRVSGTVIVPRMYCWWD